MGPAAASEPGEWAGVSGEQGGDGEIPLPLSMGKRCAKGKNASPPARLRLGTWHGPAVGPGARASGRHCPSGVKFLESWLGSLGGPCSRPGGSKQKIKLEGQTVEEWD